jgi:ribosomal protein S18 acetylase RimI-like enzyme
LTPQTVIARAEVKIRRLTIADLGSFRDIRAEAIQNYPQSFATSEEDQGGEAMVAAYRHWLSDTILGAFERENLTGVAGFYVSPDKRARHRGHIFTVYVKEHGRGQGVGDRLIKELLALAEARVEQVHLAVVLTATAAIKTYQRNGFDIYGTDPRAIRIGEVAYDKYLMVKNFSR